MTAPSTSAQGPVAGSEPLTRAQWLMLPGHAQKRLSWLEAALTASPPAEALPSQTSGAEAGDEALKVAIERALDAESTLEAWFDLAEKTEAEAVPVILDGLKGYLRTSRSGGMPADLSDKVEAVLEDFCHNYLGRALVPVLRGIAAALSSPASSSPADAEALQAGVEHALRTARAAILNGGDTLKAITAIDRALSSAPAQEDGSKDLGAHPRAVPKSLAAWIARRGGRTNTRVTVRASPMSAGTTSPKR